MTTAHADAAIIPKDDMRVIENMVRSLESIDGIADNTQRRRGLSLVSNRLSSIYTRLKEAHGVEVACQLMVKAIMTRRLNLQLRTVLELGGIMTVAMPAVAACMYGSQVE